MPLGSEHARVLRRATLAGSVTANGRGSHGPEPMGRATLSWKENPLPNVSLRPTRLATLMVLTIAAGVFVAACSEDRPPALVVGMPVIGPMPSFEPDPDEDDDFDDLARLTDGGARDAGSDAAPDAEVECKCGGCPVTLYGGMLSVVVPCGYSVCSSQVKQTCTSSCRMKRTSC